MTSEAINNQVEEIINIVRSNYPDSPVNLIKKAYDLAKEAHGEQKRRSGEPYIVHPVAVAYILAQYHMDVETIVAALLHDVIEDTNYTKEDLEVLFNDEIAYMVDGVSKITRLRYQSKEESQAEYIRKMVLSMSNDIRIIMIKLVDRLHNMRTLEYMSSAKQIEKSRETLDIYAPIANRLGIQSIKSELEDLAFHYLEPEQYDNLKKKVKKFRLDGQSYIDRMVKKIESILKENNIEAKVYGRKKHLYSLYRKMQKTGRKFDEIYDLYAIRIITKSVEDCYLALGIIHTNWNALSNRMKDYITRPKANGYQSFHTTIIDDNAKPLEIQIRTEEMHEMDEYGIAAHWKYKEGRGASKGKERKFEEDISWIRRLIDWSIEFENASEFLETMKVDILNEETYVYTPKGKIIELPTGSCPIDFAYRIHTDVGNQCIGAKVNDKIVPLTYELKLGDIVTIITAKNSNGPSRDWLNFVKTNHAKNKIKQYFKRVDRQENIVHGKSILESEVKKLGSISDELLQQKNLEKLAASLNYQTLDELYLSLGVGSIKTGSILNQLQRLFSDLFAELEEPKEELVISEPSKKNKADVIVAGETDIETHLANCCHPVPGDRIVGYVNQAHGITVHRLDCENIMKLDETERLIDCQWATQNKLSKYSADLFIETYNKKGSIVNVLKPFYDLNIPIIATNSRTANNSDYFNISCEVNNARTLSQLINNIKNVPEVIKVSRK